MKPFTLADVEALNPCADALAYARSYAADPARGWELCERADWMLWFLERRAPMDKPVAVRFAVACARRVLPLFELCYPNDKRPRTALEAAENWLEGQTDDAYAAARAAADAAADTAYAAKVGEHKWQATQLRKLVPNPFGKPLLPRKRAKRTPLQNRL